MKNMKLSHIAALLFAGTFASSCISGAVAYGTYKKYNDNRVVIAHEIEILGGIPVRPFHTIAKVEAWETHETTLSNLVEKIKAEAESLGADAIIPTQISGDDSPATLVYQAWPDSFQKHTTSDAPVITGLAIKYD
jgi:hypothetical protein